MKKYFLWTPAILILMLPSCKRENKECMSLDKANQLALREQQLDEREALLYQREQALDLQSEDRSPAESNAGNKPAEAMQRSVPRTVPADHMIIHHSYAGNVVPRRNYVQPSSRFTAGQFPEGSDRILNQKDVENLSPWGAQIMLNEIYARHGLIFQQAELRKHFLAESWYKESSRNVNKKLTATEKKNIQFLKNFMAGLKTY